MIIKLAVIASGLLLGSITLKAEKPELGPDAEFFKGLQKLEQNYIKAIRKKAEKSASVEVFQIAGMSTDADPLNPEDDKVFFTIKEDGRPHKLLILKTGKTVQKPAEIKAWVNAILPAEEQAFAMCIPDYGFGVRFIDQDGHTIYSTRICLKCTSTEVSYPNYTSRLGFDPKVVKKLIDASGLSPDN